MAGAGVLWVALLVRGYRPPRSWWLPAVLGLLEPALAYLGDTFGLSLTSAVHGAVIRGLESGLMVLLAAVLLREAVTRPAILAIVVALGTIVRWTAGSGSETVSVAPRFWLIAVLVGAGGFGLSFLLFNTVIVQVDAGRAAVVLNLIPVFGVASAVVFLGEGMTPRDALGAVLIGSSVVYFAVADHREATAQARGGIQHTTGRVTVLNSPLRSGACSPVTELARLECGGPRPHRARRPGPSAGVCHRPRLGVIRSLLAGPGGATSCG